MSSSLSWEQDYKWAVLPAGFCRQVLLIEEIFSHSSQLQVFKYQASKTKPFCSVPGTEREPFGCGPSIAAWPLCAESCSACNLLPFSLQLFPHRLLTFSSLLWGLKLPVGHSLLSPKAHSWISLLGLTTPFLRGQTTQLQGYYSCSNPGSQHLLTVIDSLPFHLLLCCKLCFHHSWTRQSEPLHHVPSSS